MEQKQLNDELTIVGLILILLFIIYQLVVYANTVEQLKDKVTESQRWVIYLDKRLTHTESELSNTKETVETLSDKLQEKTELDKILKDIATSWDKPKN